MTQLIDRTGFISDTFQGVVADLASADGGGADGRPAALRIEATTEAEDLAPRFGTLSMIVIPFGSSADGRGFSLARRLRALGYRGVIRAEGHVLPDQFRAALRIGIDQIAISDAQAARHPEADWKSVHLAEDYRTRLFGG